MKYKLLYNRGRIWPLCKGHPEKPALCGSTAQCLSATIALSHLNIQRAGHLTIFIHSIGKVLWGKSKMTCPWRTDYNISVGKWKDMHLIMYKVRQSSRWVVYLSAYYISCLWTIVEIGLAKQDFLWTFSVHSTTIKMLLYYSIVPGVKQWSN